LLGALVRGEAYVLHPRRPASVTCAVISKVFKGQDNIWYRNQSDTFAHNCTTKSRRNTKIGRKVVRVTAHGSSSKASSKVKRSKVEVIRLLWVDVQVTTCRGGAYCGGRTTSSSSSSYLFQVTRKATKAHYNKNWQAAQLVNDKGKMLNDDGLRSVESRRPS